MKPKSLWIASWMLMALAAAFTPAAAQAAECSLASAAGSWAYSFSGSVFNQQSNAFVPAASAGVITFDGKGNASGSESFSVAANTTDETYSGTYTEKADCSGSFTLIIKPSGQTVSGKFYAGNSDNEAYVIFTSPGITMAGTTKRVKYRGI